MTDHGLSEAALETIRAILANFGDEITQVDLFGSRATGSKRENSDIDLVVHRDVREATIDRLWTLFNESNLPFSVDVAGYESTTYPPIREHIDAVSQCLFTAEEIRDFKKPPGL